MAKVVLVDGPAWVLNRPKDFFMLGLAYLAGVLREAGHDVTLMLAHEVTSWDAENFRMVVHPEKMPECDYLGVTSTTPQIAWAQEMARAWPAKVKILGGPHATYVMGGPYEEYKKPEYFEAFDYVLTGECDETLPRFLVRGPEGIPGGWKVGESAMTPLDGNSSPPLCNVAKMSMPAFDLFDGRLPQIRLRHDGKSEPRKFASMFTSKGCPFACAFCAEARTPVRPLPLEQVEGQLKLLASLRVGAVHFYDDTFNLKQERCRKVADLASEYGMEWRSALRTNPNLYSAELFNYFRERGCVELEFGVEHASRSVLKNMEKAIRPEDSERAIKTAQDCGLSAYALLMMGFPGETLKTIDELREWVRRVRPDSAVLSMFQAIPGSRVWNEPERFGVKLKHADKGFLSTWCWFLDKEDIELSVELPTISQADLLKAHRELTAEFRSLAGVA